MDLISVIVPVYKVEPYLDCCVASIVAQTYKNLEIILVDDGSPDNCPQMCDDWAKKDDRIKVIHQSNKGGGAARNAGIDIAGGDYLTFVDSDDYISPNMYELLLRAVKEAEADIAECGFTKTTDSSALFRTDDYTVNTYSTVDALSAHINDRSFCQLIWNKLYRKEIVYGVRFPVGTKIDDEFFTYQLIGNARLLAKIPCVLYAYRQQQGSVMHSLSSERRMEAINAKLLRHSYLIEHYPELTDESLKNLWLTGLYQGQLVLRESNNSAAKEMMQTIKKTMKDYPLPAKKTFMDGLWLNLAKHSFFLACRIRNLLKVGC